MRVRQVLIAVIVAVAAACGDTPTTPSGGGQTPPTPPVVVNTPPTISDMKTADARVDADNEVGVSATVKDAETPLDQLTYTWSATPANGSFSGSGASVKWRAPKGQKSPDVYTITLTVTEKYTSAGQPQQNVVNSSVTIHYNDTLGEVDALAVQFYKDFGTYSVSAADCVRNFADSCPGKAEERSQIQANRDRTDYRIVGSTLTSTPNIGVTPDITGASFLQPCSFEDVSTTNGKHVRVDGGCYLTLVYQNWQWWICTSSFLNGVATTLDLHKMVPGRVISRLP